jgi:hypothetical protein
MSLSIQTPRLEQLLLEQKCYTQQPENGKLVKIARLYANAFADLPWNEYKVCENRHYFGLQQAELTSCTECSQPLAIAYPEGETADYITKEITKPEGTLVTFEDGSGEVLAAGWGYACAIEDLQGKYNSSEMQAKVVEKIKNTVEKVQNVFYVSEIMVDTTVRKQGIASKITQGLVDQAQSLNLKSVMRTRADSPMVQIADRMQMTKIIAQGEDTDNLNRVLFIKI